MRSVVNGLIGGRRTSGTSRATLEARCCMCVTIPRSSRGRCGLRFNAILGWTCNLLIYPVTSRPFPRDFKLTLGQTKLQSSKWLISKKIVSSCNSKLHRRALKFKSPLLGDNKARMASSWQRSRVGKDFYESFPGISSRIEWIFHWAESLKKIQ